MGINNETRKRLIEMYNEGKTVTDISTIFNLKRTTVSSIISVYIKHGRDTKNFASGRRKLLNDDIVNYIKQEINENCGITLEP